jgi:Zn-dependent protease with chaperone function
MKAKQYLKQIQQVTKLAWSPNNESNISGYKIHYGTQSRKYDKTIDVGNPINEAKSECQTQLYLLPETKYYIAITSYDTNNNESPYSDEIATQEGEQIQEFDIDPEAAIGVGAGIATFLILKELIFFFIFAAQIARQTKVDPKMSKRLNEILKKMGVNKVFSAHVVPQKAPNAFTPGGKHVYMTTGLMKVLNEREVDAVLLHEVYHAIDHHVLKRMATEFPLYYIAAPIAVATATAAFPISMIIGIIVFTIMMAIMKIPLTLLLYRKHEYDADNYAVKAGYGKEMASALTKLEKEYVRLTQGRQCGKVCKVVERIEQSMDEHPQTRDRIERALKNAELMKAIAKANISAITTRVKSLFGKGK